MPVFVRTDRPRQMKLRACLGNDDWTPWKLVAGSTELQAPQMVGLDELKVVFNRFDRNRSGRLDFRELVGQSLLQRRSANAASHRC